MSPEMQSDFAEQMAVFLPEEVRLAEPKIVALEGARVAIGEMHAGSSTARAALEPFVSARHPSQLYQAACEGLLTLLVCWIVFRGRRKPGVVSAWFLIVYGVGRISTEFIRLPDAHLQVQRLLGLSRGQWLSAAMVVAGVLLLVWISKRSVDSMAGWGTPRAERPAQVDLPGSRESKNKQEPE
jgi:prolipoprotein diacylglyceryltransferase